jgi:hypothetical protein
MNNRVLFLVIAMTLVACQGASAQYGTNPVKLSLSFENTALEVMLEQRE